MPFTESHSNEIIIVYCISLYTWFMIYFQTSFLNFIAKIIFCILYLFYKKGALIFEQMFIKYDWSRTQNGYFTYQISTFRSIVDNSNGRIIAIDLKK